jgi:hypothetical protein
MTDQRCLTSAIARRSALIEGHRDPQPDYYTTYILLVSLLEDIQTFFRITNVL